MNIIILAGYSCAGKSTLARAYSDKYNCGYIDHQNLIHRIAQNNGFDRARHWLKSVGIELFIDISTKEIINEIRLLQDKEIDSIITDVSYGMKMLNEISSEFPKSRIFVVKLNASKSTRKKRIAFRMGNVNDRLASKELNFRDNFLKQANLDEVLRNATINLYNDSEIDNVVKELYNELQKR